MHVSFGKSMPCTYIYMCPPTDQKRAGEGTGKEHRDRHRERGKKKEGPRSRNTQAAKDASVLTMHFE
jgi:hypothetical protein